MGKDYDIVLFLHADILTTQDEFKKLTDKEVTKLETIVKDSFDGFIG